MWSNKKCTYVRTCLPPLPTDTHAHARLTVLTYPLWNDALLQRRDGCKEGKSIVKSSEGCTQANSGTFTRRRSPGSADTGSAECTLLLLRHPDGHRSQTQWTPDYRPEVTVFGLYAVSELVFRVAGLAAPSSRLFAADGCELCCVSSGDVTFQLDDVSRPSACLSWRSSRTSSRGVTGV